MGKKVAIILGNRVNDDGTITEIQKERLEMAIEIENEFHPDYFILSGGSPNKLAGISEAKGMYDYLVAKGFNKDKLILEYKNSKKIYLFFTSIAWTLMMITKLKSYQLGKIMIVAPLSSLTVILNIIVSYFLLKEKSNLIKKIIAGILIIIGIILIKL